MAAGLRPTSTTLATPESSTSTGCGSAVSQEFSRFCYDRKLKFRIFNLSENSNRNRISKFAMKFLPSTVLIRRFRAQFIIKES